MASKNYDNSKTISTELMKSKECVRKSWKRISGKMIFDFQRSILKGIKSENRILGSNKIWLACLISREDSHSQEFSAKIRRLKSYLYFAIDERNISVSFIKTRLKLKISTSKWGPIALNETGKQYKNWGAEQQNEMEMWLMTQSIVFQKRITGIWKFGIKYK